MPHERLASGAATRAVTHGKAQMLARLMGGAPGLLVFAHLYAGVRCTPPGMRTVDWQCHLARESVRNETKTDARRLRSSGGSIRNQRSGRSGPSGRVTRSRSLARRRSLCEASRVTRTLLGAIFDGRCRLAPLPLAMAFPRSIVAARVAPAGPRPPCKRAVKGFLSCATT